MDSSARLSPPLARVWHGSVMRDGAAALFLLSSLFVRRDFNIAARSAHCPVVVWRAAAYWLCTRSRGRSAAASIQEWGRLGPYGNMVHFMCIDAKSSLRRGRFDSLTARSLGKLESIGDFKEATSKQNWKLTFWISRVEILQTWINLNFLSLWSCSKPNYFFLLILMNKRFRLLQRINRLSFCGFHLLL